MYVASVDGTEAGHRMMARMRDTVVETPLEGPIHLGTRLGHLRNDRRIFRRIVYNKSAVVLHMLRRLIGDDAFLAGLRRAYEDHRFTLIDVDDIREAFQAETPLPLERFFTRWVHESGQPRLRFSWSQASTGSIAVRVEQPGDVFDVPHDVVVQHADGSSLRVPLAITRDDETFTIPVRGPVRRVELDDPLTIASVVR
jgi:aminopeptidase N